MTGSGFRNAEGIEVLWLAGLRLRRRMAGRTTNLACGITVGAAEAAEGPLRGYVSRRGSYGM